MRVAQWVPAYMMGRRRNKNFLFLAGFVFHHCSNWLLHKKALHGVLSGRHNGKMQSWHMMDAITGPTAHDHMREITPSKDGSWKIRLLIIVHYKTQPGNFLSRGLLYTGAFHWYCFEAGMEKRPWLARRLMFIRSCLGALGAWSFCCSVCLPLACADALVLLQRYPPVLVSWQGRGNHLFVDDERFLCCRLDALHRQNAWREPDGSWYAGSMGHSALTRRRGAVLMSLSTIIVAINAQLLRMQKI